jgi:hypothetical protein
LPGVPGDDVVEAGLLEVLAGLAAADLVQVFNLLGH